MKSRLTLFIVIAATIAGCSSPLTKPSPGVETARRVLLEQACPETLPLADPTFGATTVKLIEVGGQYRACRCVALELPCQQSKEAK